MNNEKPETPAADQTSPIEINLEIKKLEQISCPADLARYIEFSNNEKLLEFEKLVGLDNTWKILTLTSAATLKEAVDMFAETLKFGEATAMAYFDKAEFKDILKALVSDTLRGLTIAGGAGGILSKIVKLNGQLRRFLSIKIDLQKPVQNKFLSYMSAKELFDYLWELQEKLTDNSETKPDII